MKGLRSEDGSTLVELAVYLPILLLFVFALVDYAFYIQKALQVQDAAATGAAYGTIPGNAANSTTMVQLANYEVTGSYNGASGFTANATNFYSCTPGGAPVALTASCSGSAPLHYVQVTTSLNISSLLPYTGLPHTQSINGSAIYRVEVTP